MSREIDKLTPDTRILWSRTKLYFGEATDNHELLCFSTLRTCAEQARLFRSTRTRAQIDAKAQSYRDRELDFLREILYEVGPQSGELGKHVTGAGPGESWHQYAMAFDAVPVRNGRAVWDDKDPIWELYGAAARAAGGNWGGDWSGSWDKPHTQLLPQRNPLAQWSPTTVYERLQSAGAL